jgi:plastocyanin
MKYHKYRRAIRILCLVGLSTFYAPATDVASAGTIKGSVRYAGAPTPKKKFPVTIDQYLCGTEKEAGDLTLSPTNGILNAVVMLQGVPAGSKGPSQPTTVKMDQKQCEFVPRVVVVPTGGTVEFLNSDRLLHNVRSNGRENSPFNRAQPHARTIAIAFKSPEILRVDCDLHSWMRAWVVVTEHPFYAITSEDGEFVFDNVPPGKYTLQVWHESLGRMNQEIVVTGDTTTVAVRMQKK